MVRGRTKSSKRRKPPKYLPGEKWGKIRGYKHHRISNFGRILSCARWLTNVDGKSRFWQARIMKTQFSWNGYECINLDGRGKVLLIHRLVAKAFIPNPRRKRCVNHKNGRKSDNRARNLEWCTHSENMIHGYEKGLIDRRVGRAGPQGSKHGGAKLTEVDIPVIRSKYKAGMSRKDIGIEYGISAGAVWTVVARKNWTHVK